MIKFRSNGKFLITGEYLVRSGARALAIPLKTGQSLQIEETERNNILDWTASDLRGKWFLASLSLPDLEILETSDEEKGKFLQKTLLVAQRLNPAFLSSNQGYWVDSFLEADRDWGMGSSSTFIVNLSQWACVDPYHMHHKISTGSGYDIACAQAEKPLIYQKNFEGRSIEKVNWIPRCRKHLAFVYLGKKQNTEESLKKYRNLDFTDRELKRISGITDEFWLVNNEIDLMSLVWEHEEIMSKILKKNPIQDKLFRDFNGAIKSLGAWGGDFILAVGRDKIKKIRPYFHAKGYQTVFSWDEVIIDN